MKLLMKTSAHISHALAALTAITSIGNALPAEETTLFADSFADVKGYVIGQTDGKIFKTGEAATRRLLPFMGLSPQTNGKLTIVAFEDPATVGFDGKPGVLAISLTDIPKVATYCGFAYLGGVEPEKALNLKEIAAEPHLENLKHITLRFRFKAQNLTDMSAVGATFGCRLEPLVENSYAARIGLAPIQATNEWQLFESTLDKGQNVENFVKSVDSVPSPGFKIIWSQAGSIASYQAGDALLIDDLQITRRAP
jgi:hypothetical protein